MRRDKKREAGDTLIGAAVQVLGYAVLTGAAIVVLIAYAPG